MLVRQAGERKLPKVFLVSGLAVTRRWDDGARAETEVYLDHLTAGNDPDHPGRELLDHLNGRGGRVLQARYDANVHAVRAGLLRRLAEAPADPEILEEACYTARVLAGMEAQDLLMRYRTGERTARISAVGMNVNLLPRPYRERILAGCVSADLVAAQLAIAAKLYGCPQLQSYLSTGAKVWDYFYAALGLGPEAKPILKVTVYSIVFMMREGSWDRDGLRKQLAEGERVKKNGRWVTETPGVGRELAGRFFDLPLVRELLDRREAVKTQVTGAGGMEDAFGRWIAATPERPDRKVLAAVAQSYEFRLMLSVLGPVKTYGRSCSLVSWLHDGIYLWFPPSAQEHKSACLGQIEAAVARTAGEIGMHTRLEIQEPELRATRLAA